MSSVGDLLISRSSAFQTVGALTEKDLSPNVLNLPTLTDNKIEFDDLRDFFVVSIFQTD